MRLHFAAEVILELVSQKWGLKKIGAHIVAEPMLNQLLKLDFFL